MGRKSPERSGLEKLLMMVLSHGFSETCEACRAAHVYCSVSHWTWSKGDGDGVGEGWLRALGFKGNLHKIFHGEFLIPRRSLLSIHLLQWYLRVGHLWLVFWSKHWEPSRWCCLDKKKKISEQDVKIIILWRHILQKIFRAQMYCANPAEIISCTYTEYTDLIMYILLVAPYNRFLCWHFQELMIEVKMEFHFSGIFFCYYWQRCV